MITYDQIRSVILNEANYSKMRDWVFDKMENSDMDIDQMRAAFVKKYGKQNLKHMEKAVDEFEGTMMEAKYDYADMVSWVGDKMENSDMDIDQMRAAFVKKFGRNATRYFEAAVDELND